MLPAFSRISILSLLIGSSWLRAGIVWEKTEVEVTPKKGEAKIEVPFIFKVEEGQAVQILDVGSSCGCTVPRLEKRMYSPGETGVLSTIFTAGIRQGRQTKEITVKSLESGKETQTKLTIIVNLPEWAKPELSRLEWKAGEDVKKSLRINVLPDIRLAIKPIAALATERFSVELNKDEGGSTYTLSASPVPNKSRGMTPVLIDIFQAEKQVSSMTLFLLR